ncbi:hypothetical protein NUU61_008735 [Penicillium alfredii]|uniref:Transcription factor hoxa13 n=1 Tax=Penicillium alfredii TaxID=1506179 RepID=A0A9W9ELU9_9EURO|nr:uncharacterized protein NUU61_008735 [Penicillium alfredii]KAJ5084156.1 hypothetical protein NUU61_008735 [Penicillium alfredii]
MVAKENGRAPDAAVKSTERKDPGNARERKSSLRWTVGLVVRLCIWYALITPFLRCPSDLSGLNDTSPRVCKPYLIARSHVEPYISPYYNTYAAPYVDQARPYVEIVHQQVYIPASGIAKSGYDKYGAPSLAQAQAYGAEQWRLQVTPRLQNVQDKANQLYTAEVDPYVQQGVAIVSPYYQHTNTVVRTVYWDYLVPFYTQSKPFIGKTYTAGQDIVINHVMPGARSTWSAVVYFANSSLWPQITGLYSEQVEPQLVKIGQRLASYREGKRLRAVVEESESPCHRLSRNSRGKTQTSTSVTTTSTSVTPPSQPTLSPTEQAQQARERIATDLERWQHKFAVAADKGVEDLEERIEEIVAGLVSSSANSHGASLSTALQSVAADQVSTIQQRINDLVKSLPEEDAPEAEDSTRHQLVSDIRNSAINVRDRAQALREWSLSFDDELLRRVSAAVNSTADVLDSIRDLGLQEIGIRWAWMDGVTYKDWARYHALKVQLEDWRNAIREVGMNHKSIAEARSVATGILDHGMEVAEETAKELVRLKDVGYWKIAAREVSDNFDTRTEPPPPRSQPQSEPEDETEGSENQTLETDHDESSEANSYTPAPSSVSEAEDSVPESENLAPKPEDTAAEDSHETFVTEDEAGDQSVWVDEIVEDENVSAKPAWGVAAADVPSKQEPVFEDEDQIVNSASQTTSKSSNGPLVQISSIASSRLNEGLSIASEQLAQVTQTAPATSSVGSQPFVLDAQRRYYEAVGLAHEHYTAFVSTASHAVYGTPTPTPPPINVQAMIEEAGSQYEHASSLASASLAAVVASASSAISSVDNDQSQRIIDDASSRYSAALSAASASLSLASASASSAFYGTSTESLESFSIQASENWENLVSKASQQFYGAPTPYLQQVIDNRRLEFEAVQGIVSELFVGKQPSFTESVMSKLHAVYETPYPAAAVSSASSYLDEAYGSASSVAAAYVTGAPSVEDIMQRANDQLNAAIEVASVGIYGTPKGSYEQATDAAADAYSTASARISSAVYGKESNYIDVAKDSIKKIQSQASAAIYGEEPGAVESATSRLALAVESAQSRVADLASSASSAASEAADTATSHVDDVTNSIKNAASLAKDEL